MLKTILVEITIETAEDSDDPRLTVDDALIAYVEHATEINGVIHEWRFPEDSE